MQKKAWPATVFTCVIGAFAMFLRWLQMNNIIDETGLLLRGSSFSLAVVIVDLIAAAGILAFSLSLRGSIKEAGVPVLPRFQSVGQPALAAISLILLLIGSIEMLAVGDFPRKLAAVALIAACAALCKIMLSKNENTKLGALAALSCLPAIAVSVLLIIEYRLINKEPQIWIFAPRILAFSFSALGFYYFAGFPFCRAKPTATVFIMLLACFLCLAAVADPLLPAGQTLILIALAIIFIIEAWTVISVMTAASKETAKQTTDD
jgi:hypothetical protein